MHIRFDRYTKILGRNKVIDDVSLDMYSGTIYGFRGQNGSGKTMLMRAVCGLILPTEGSVAIDGMVIGKDISFPDSVGLLLENPAFIGGYSGFKNLKMIASIKKIIGDSRITEVMEAVGLEPGDKRPYRKYSLGMKQKLGIACAIMEEPDLIILDEPFNALDEAGAENVRNVIMEAKDRGALVIVACHDKEQLDELADEIVIIDGGRISGYEVP